MKVTFTINFASDRYRPVGNPREHWGRTHERAKAQRSFTRNHLLALGKKPPGLPAKVRLVRIAQKPFDDDNLRTALKAFRDEVSAYLKHQGGFGNWWDVVRPGDGDGEDDPVTWEYAQEKAPRGRHAVRVEIEGPGVCTGASRKEEA